MDRIAEDSLSDGTLAAPFGSAVSRTTRSQAVRPLANGFAVGTRIDTPSGKTAVERLGCGDMVVTRDDGPQAVLWTSGAIKTPSVCLPGHRPDVGDPGLGNVMTVVTPGTRVLLSNDRTQLLFGTDEVLAEARDIISHLPMGNVPMAIQCCVAVMLEQHGLVRAGGFWVETLSPDPDTLATFDAAVVGNLFGTHPRLRHDAAQAAYVVSRPVLIRREVALVL